MTVKVLYTHIYTDYSKVSRFCSLQTEHANPEVFTVLQTLTFRKAKIQARQLLC